MSLASISVRTDAAPAASTRLPAVRALHRRQCRECGSGFASPRVEAAFCGDRCRRSFHLRREQRGAELYDLWMALRYDRGAAQLRGVWSLISRLGQIWREEDRRERDGRASWTPLREVEASGRLTRVSYLSRVYHRAGK